MKTPAITSPPGLPHIHFDAKYGVARCDNCGSELWLIANHREGIAAIRLFAFAIAHATHDEVVRE